MPRIKNFKGKATSKDQANMTRTLLTGGSGFIAAHILDVLLQRGHSVVTTVRSQEKAEQIKKSHPHISKENLGFVIVPDISAPNGN